MRNIIGFLIDKNGEMYKISAGDFQRQAFVAENANPMLFEEMMKFYMQSTPEEAKVMDRLTEEGKTQEVLKLLEQKLDVDLSNVKISSRKLRRLSVLVQEAPMKSKKQRRWMWANDPEMAQEFEDKTPEGTKLPEKVGSEEITEGDLGNKRVFGDIVVNVENPAGTERYGIEENGHEWRTQMKYDYGFIYGPKGKDDEGVDVYLGPNQEAKSIFVIHQNNPDTGEYDEDKVLLGFDSKEDAKNVYLIHYDRPEFFGSMDEFSMQDFKKALNREEKIFQWKKNK